MLFTAEIAAAVLALSASVAAAPAPKFPCLLTPALKAKGLVCPGGFDKRAEPIATPTPTNVEVSGEGRGVFRFGPPVFDKRDAQNVGYIWDGHSTQTITIPAATATKTKVWVWPKGFDKRAEATATPIPTNAEESAEGREPFRFGPPVFDKRDAQNVGYIWDGHSTQTITIHAATATPTKKFSFRLFDKKDEANVEEVGWNRFDKKDEANVEEVGWNRFDKKDEANVEEVGWNRFDKKEVAEATAPLTPTNVEQPDEAGAWKFNFVKWFSRRNEAETQVEEAAAAPTKTALQILKGPWKWDKRETEEERAEPHLILPKEKKSEMNVAYLDPHDINLNPKRSDAHLGLPKQ